MKNALITIIVFGILLTSWELFSHINNNWIFVLPSPSQIVIRLLEKSDRFWFHTKVTLSEMLWGCFLAFIVAFPLAWFMDVFRSARSVLQPFFIIIQCIPMFTLAPIMVIWFGWSSIAIVIPTALMIFFPLTMSIYKGLRSTPQDLLDYFYVNQATTWQTFFKLKLPWAMPYIFGGLRVGTAIAGIAAVAGEWAGAQVGLGVLMVESRRDTDLETNFAALFCLTIVSCLLYLITVGFETLAAQRRPIRAILKKLWLSKRLKTSTAILLIGLCLTGCQSNDSTLSTQSVRMTLDWLPNPNHIPLYLGISKGFFKEQGFDLILQKLQDPGHATPYLTSGQTDLALAYMPHTIRIHQKGAKIKPIAILVQEPLNGIIYRKGANIHAPKDLNGKAIGYCTGGKECVFLDTFLNENQIHPSIKRNVGFDLVTCLGIGLVDAIYGAYWNIETEHLRSLGMQIDFFKLTDFGVPNYYELIVLAKADSIYAQPDFTKRFQTALQQSIEYSKLHPDEAFNIYFLSQPDKSEKTKIWEHRAWQSTLPALANHQDISKEVWQTFEKWLTDHQLL